LRRRRLRRRPFGRQAKTRATQRRRTRALNRRKPGAIAWTYTNPPTTDGTGRHCHPNGGRLWLRQSTTKSTTSASAPLLLLLPLSPLLPCRIALSLSSLAQRRTPLMLFVCTSRGQRRAESRSIVGAVVEATRGDRIGIAPIPRVTRKIPT
jgi:hypothetical protein